MCGRTWRLFQTLGAALLAAGFFGGCASAQDARLDVPSGVAPGAAFEVDWRGPDARGDFVAIAEPGEPAASFIAYARTSDGSPAVLRAPGVGEYEVRYILAADLSILAKVALRVSEEPAQPGLQAPSQVHAGTGVAVSLPDPGDPADYVTIVETGAPNRAFGAYVRLRGAREVSLPAPEAPGAYEIRHVQARDLTVLARAPLQVLAPLGTEATPPAAQSPETGRAKAAVTGSRADLETEVSLTALIAVDQARDFRVAWSGRDGEGDHIAIVPRGGGPGAAIESRPAGGGSPVGFAAPDAPGEYEIVFIDGVSGEVLAARPLEVR